MADYPSAIFGPRAKENRSGVVYDASKKTVGFVEDITLIEDEVIALETDLEARKYAITFVIDGGGSAITTGLKGFLEIPFACTIEKCTLLADVSGAIKIDIWKDIYSNFPPANADSICGGNEPEIAASGVKDQDATLTSWTKTIAAGDILAFNVDSCATITRLTINLTVKK